jgi:hypothetical protein
VSFNSCSTENDYDSPSILKSKIPDGSIKDAVASGRCEMDRKSKSNNLKPKDKRARLKNVLCSTFTSSNDEYVDLPGIIEDILINTDQVVHLQDKNNMLGVRFSTKIFGYSIIPLVYAYYAVLMHMSHYKAMFKTNKYALILAFVRHSDGSYKVLHKGVVVTRNTSVRDFIDIIGLYLLRLNEFKMKEKCHDINICLCIWL